MQLAHSLLALALAASALPCAAQMRKCTDATTGKVSYSDVVCPNTAQEGKVVTKDNTLDASGSRKQVAQAAAAKASEEKQAKADAMKAAQEAKKAERERDAAKREQANKSPNNGGTSQGPILPPKPNIR